MFVDNSTVSVKNATQSVTVTAKTAVQTTQPPPVVVSTAGKTEVTSSVQDVHAFDEKPSFVGEANYSIILECSLQGDIKWFKNNEEIKSDEKHFKVFQANGSLQVHKVGKIQQVYLHHLFLSYA